MMLVEEKLDDDFFLLLWLLLVLLFVGFEFDVEMSLRVAGAIATVELHRSASARLLKASPKTRCTSATVELTTASLKSHSEFVDEKDEEAKIVDAAVIVEFISLLFLLSVSS